MKHYLKIILILLFPLVSLSQTNEELSISFIKKLQNQQFDSCHKMFDTVVSNKISSTMLEQMWQSIPKYMGEYKSFSTITTEKKDSNTVVFILCEFEKTKMDLQLAYNTQKKIVGIFFTPPKNKTAYVYPEYAQQNKYYESKTIVQTGKYSLPGIICIPNHTKNPPVVILLAGSGPNDKDETIGGNKLLKDLAVGLASNGIATLRYDKRTLVYGKEIANNINDFNLNNEVIEDALSAIKLIKSNPDFKLSKIFIVGHSLGAMCAPLISSKSKDINGIVLLAGNARPLEDLVLDQFHYIFKLDSLDREEKNQLKEIETQIEVVRDPIRLKTASADQLPLQLTSHYWQSLKSYNQLLVATKLKQPILVLQGERDYQVTMIDYNLWKLNLEGNPKNKFISYSNLNHLFMEGTGKSTPKEYEKQGNVSEKVILDIVSWIKLK